MAGSRDSQFSPKADAQEYVRVGKVGFPALTPKADLNLKPTVVYPATLSFEGLLYFGTCQKANSHCSATADLGLPA